MSQPKPKVTTTRQLAKLAGISHITISRAFRGGPGMKRETRDRIFALAKEYDYSPNPIFKLAVKARQPTNTSNITATLAFVHSYGKLKTWSKHPHLSPYWKGIVNQAANMGFSIDEFLMVPGELSPKRLADILRARGIQGIVFAPPPGFVKRVRFDWKDFSCATFQHDSWRPLLHRVSDDEKGFLKYFFQVDYNYRDGTDDWLFEYTLNESTSAGVVGTQLFNQSFAGAIRGNDFGATPDLYGFIGGDAPVSSSIVGYDNATLVSAVPEPSTAMLLMMAGLSLLVLRRKK